MTILCQCSIHIPSSNRDLTCYLGSGLASMFPSLCAFVKIKTKLLFVSLRIWGSLHLQQCISDLKKCQSIPHAFKNLQLWHQNQTPILLSYSRNETKSTMCIRLARTCPDCFIFHSITRLKTCQEYKDMKNCPSRQLREILTVPHSELCDRCYCQDQAVQEVSCAVAKAMLTNFVRGNGYLG